METIREFLKPEVIWFVVGVVLLIMEFAVPGLIIFFFGVGAWIVALVCFLTDISLNAQLLIFISSSVLCLLCLRKWLKSIFIGHVKAKQNMKEDLSDFVDKRPSSSARLRRNSEERLSFTGPTRLICELPSSI